VSRPWVLWARDRRITQCEAVEASSQGADWPLRRLGPPPLPFAKLGALDASLVVLPPVVRAPSGRPGDDQLSGCIGMSNSSVHPLASRSLALWSRSRVGTTIEIRSSEG
jgi:hypothetical protein